MKPVMLALLLVLLLTVPPPLTLAAASPSSCRFFAETGGYSVCDDDQARFLSAFNRWGLQKIGYPISRRYEQDGFVTQAFQKAIMQWRADSGTVALVNIFDDLDRRGFNQQLFSSHQIPQPLPLGWDGAGLTFQQVVQKRQALLASRPALRAAYLASGDPLTFFGLPTSQITDMGSHYAIRLQRAVLQEWKSDVPWARRGEVTIANGGQIARDLGALPGTALQPESATSAPAPAPASAPPQFDATVREIDLFWQAQFSGSGQPYRSPKVVPYWGEGIQTPCGFVELGNAAYCAGARTIYYDATFLNELQQQVGRVAPATVLAHEWGHHIQYELRLIPPSFQDRELQADCLAGAFASRTGLNDNDAQSVIALFQRAGNSEATELDNPFAHGNGEQRHAAFTRGAREGMAGCLGN